MATTERADATRTRILEAAWQLISGRGGHQAVSMAEIATAAGVSRQLVYLDFETKAGLLAAMTRWVDETSGFGQRINDAVCLPRRDGLEQLIRTWLEYLPVIVPVASALESAPAGDAGRKAWDERMNDLREAFRFVIATLDEAGLLKAGWTVDTAADWAWGRSHLSAWRHMVLERGWSPEEYADRCVRSVLDELVAGG
jgi:AcrR family transcriptional regulator